MLLVTYDVLDPAGQTAGPTERRAAHHVVLDAFQFVDASVLLFDLTKDDRVVLFLPLLQGFELGQDFPEQECR